MKRILPLALVAAAVLLHTGCSEKEKSPPSKAEQFKADNGATITPHGPIELGSVAETSDGKLSYKTKDGTGWTVGVTKAADGSNRYDEPKRISP